jgi:translation initiation factor 1
MVKRRRTRRPEGTTTDNTRLVYSTGGETPAEPEPPPSATPPKGPGIRLRLERRASGRVVTVVSGLPGRPSEVTTLGRELKSACGAGGTVKDGILEIQGDQRDRIEAALAARGLRFKRSGG